jgi:hypothetical protein
VGKDQLHDELVITAPHLLTKPWKTNRISFRQRAQKFDIVEGVCIEGTFRAAKDAKGFDIYVPIPIDIGGNRIPPQ